ncbi:putative centrosomal protein POC5 [Blattamonas nauphoetae]|uniref:Centrosomal protein POC5 n=1 Tax=Blattamonas nauphoetae TaxID=2049346 RepID=A0ABQ9YC82_9EUKA|nr:putative centrosomal protein POC5 [Blattamonas nauphoetae]
MDTVSDMQDFSSDYAYRSSSDPTAQPTSLSNSPRLNIPQHHINSDDFPSERASIDVIIDRETSQLEDRLSAFNRSFMAQIEQAMNALRMAVDSKEHEIERLKRLHSQEQQHLADELASLQTNHLSSSTLIKKQKCIIEHLTCQHARNLEAKHSHRILGMTFAAWKLGTRILREQQLRKQKAAHFHSLFLLKKSLSSWRSYTLLSSQLTHKQNVQRTINDERARFEATYGVAMNDLRSQLANATELLAKERAMRTQFNKDMRQAVFRGVTALNTETLRALGQRQDLHLDGVPPSSLFGTGWPVFTNEEPPQPSGSQQYQETGNEQWDRGTQERGIDEGEHDPHPHEEAEHNKAEVFTEDSSLCNFGEPVPNVQRTQSEENEAPLEEVEPPQPEHRLPPHSQAARHFPTSTAIRAPPAFSDWVISPLTEVFDPSGVGEDDGRLESHPQRKEPTPFDAPRSGIPQAHRIRPNVSTNPRPNTQPNRPLTPPQRQTSAKKRLIDDQRAEMTKMKAPTDQRPVTMRPASDLGKERGGRDWMRPAGKEQTFRPDRNEISLQGKKKPRP